MIVIHMSKLLFLVHILFIVVNAYVAGYVHRMISEINKSGKNQ